MHGKKPSEDTTSPNELVHHIHIYTHILPIYVHTAIVTLTIIIIKVRDTATMTSNRHEYHGPRPLCSSSGPPAPPFRSTAAVGMN